MIDISVYYCKCRAKRANYFKKIKKEKPLKYAQKIGIIPHGPIVKIQLIIKIWQLLRFS